LHCGKGLPYLEILLVAMAGSCKHGGRDILSLIPRPQRSAEFRSRGKTRTAGLRIAPSDLLRRPRRREIPACRFWPKLMKTRAVGTRPRSHRIHGSAKRPCISRDYSPVRAAMAL